MSTHVGPGKRLIAGVTATATLVSGGAVVLRASEPPRPKEKVRAQQHPQAPELVGPRTAQLPSGQTMKVDLDQGKVTIGRPKKAPKTTPKTTPKKSALTKPKVISAPSPNYDSRGGVDIDTIVLHHTASNSSASDLQAMRDPDFDVSAHFLVDRDGKIYQLVDENKRAWHAGKAQLHGVRTDVNSRSIGIEIVNNGKGQKFTEEQYSALDALVPYLAAKFKVPARNIVGHKDVAIPKGRKSDPAPNFDFRRVLAAVKESNRLQNVA